MFESETIEFKREFVEGIKQEVIAFANSEGGRIFIGVNDDGTAYGVRDVDETMLRVSNLIRGNVKPDVSMFIKISAEKLDDKDIVVIDVRRGSARPYYLTGKGVRPEGVYVRLGSASIPASEAAILDMIKETSGDSFEDARSINQDLTFGQAEEYFKQKKVAFGKEQMKSLGMIDATGLYTNLALLLSDQCPAGMKLATFRGNEKFVFQDRKELSGSLLKQFDEVCLFVERNNKLHSEVHGMFRQDTYDYPADALREALLNAIVHRDYGMTSPTLVSVFDNRIEVTNIGGLPKGYSYEDVMLGISVLRNSKLANVFYRLKLIEAYGTGLLKIRKCYESSVVKAEIQITDHVFKVTLPNMNHAADRRDEASHSLNAKQSREEIVLKLISAQKSISRSDVERALSVSQPTAILILRGMTDKGLIRRIGSGRQSCYAKAMQ